MRLTVALLALSSVMACAHATPSPAPAPDRVLVVDTDGSVVHQSTADENSRTTYAAPPAKVWLALVQAYTTLGILPTTNDRASGQYGNAGFIVPRRIAGRPISEFFSCGSTIAGPRIESGRVYGNVMSVLSDNGAGSSTVMTHVGATIRMNAGSASDPINCSSTGALELLLQKNIQRAIATP